MSKPDYALEPNADGGLVVKVDGQVAGYMSEDAEYPGLWVLENPAGRFMGRAAVPDQGALFLAACCGAEEPDWS